MTCMSVDHMHVPYSSQAAGHFLYLFICSVFYYNFLLWMTLSVLNSEITFSPYGTGGRDDAKVSIATTVILRYMFTPAEMRVGSYN